MLRGILIALIVITLTESVSIIGPRVLRPYGAYKIAVAGGIRAQTLYVALEGRRSNGEQFTQGREVQVQPGATRLIDLDIGDPGSGVYSLVARSTSGPQFSSSAPVTYQRRSFCIFIQTDKRVYQPKDYVNYRIIALDKYLKPLSGTVDISVLDSGGSPVRQWAGVLIDKGVVSDGFMLADEPGLGEWTIQVESRGQIYSRQILIADYVLPKFELDMRIPKEILFSEGRFTINVTAKHFNGLPVKGELTISAFAVFFSGLLQPVFSSPARKVIDFNGHAEVVYDLKTDLDLAEDAARPLIVEAILEEKHTHIKQNTSSRILLLRTPYRLKLTAPSYFKPTLAYNVQIELVNSDGELINTNEDITVERLWDDGSPVNITTLSLNKGHVTYSLTPNSTHANYTLNLVVKYKDISERVINVHRSSSTSDQYLTVEILSRGTSVGQDMQARITATEPMDFLHYAIIGRGDILIAKTVELSPARRSVDVTEKITPGMTPGCVLLVWYPHLGAPADAVLAASVYVPQQKLLQHEVQISVTGGGTRPGGPIDFQVKGGEGAYAALLIEDKMAIDAKLASSNGLGDGLSMHMVEREVESFNGLKHSLFSNEDHLPSMGLDLGGYTTGEVFKNSGVVVLTDGLALPYYNRGDTTTETPLETGTRPPLAGPYAFSRLPPPPSPRYYMSLTPQPTWLLTNFTLGNDGKGVDSRRLPTTTGEWLVGGFAIHPTEGLGLAAPQTFTTSLPMQITSELPNSMLRGETMAVVVTLKSSLNIDTAVEITFHNTDLYFEFEPLDNTLDSSKKIELFRRLKVTVPARGSISTAFLVTVVRKGEAPVIVEAIGNGISASLFRTIDVKEGYEEELWSLTLLDARRGVARGNATLQPRAGTRLGTTSLVAAGDLLANSIQAARGPPAPSADPTYALRPLAIASVVLDYLQATERNEVALIREARSLAASGYQRLMAYCRRDGSFAPEIDINAEGDVWMTAMAARWLARAARHVEVTPGAASAAARWLLAKQLPFGGWPEPPTESINDPRAQEPVPLAAYSLMAFIQAQGTDFVYKEAIEKAADYIARNLSPKLDAYTLAIASSALTAARHPSATNALEMMDQYANVTSTTLFWSRQLFGSEWRNPWLAGNSVATKTAANGLRTLLASRLLDNAASVARFLLYSYSPRRLDPEVLDALAEYATMIKTSNKLRLSVNVTGTEEPRQFNIDDDNALIVQTLQVRNAQSASAITEGRGLAVVGLTAKGTTNVTAAWPRYTLDPRVDKVSTKDRLQLSICIGFVAQGNETESGLTLLTVQLPSGFLADIHTITELTSAQHVTGARLQAGGERVLAWLRVVRSERCATLGAPLVRPIARQRSGWATLEDLYDSSHRARVFFQGIASSPCDVCRPWDSCSRACGAVAEQRAPEAAPDTAAPRTTHLASLLFTTALILLR